ncbi:MAG: hypothetical protein D6730_00875 [Bacteroidetes bacterium]|nr:MAG: hypothetical protein D6730_00875 [Bacteroidota bacterium]
MKQLILQIEEGKYSFFMELIQNFDFIKVQEEGDNKEAIMENLKQGFEEMKLYKDKKLKGTPLNEFLNEL